MSEATSDSAALAFSGCGILLDIEGTTSSVRYVHDVLFPFVRRELDGFLAAHWTDAAVVQACERMAMDAGAASLDAFAAGHDPRAKIKAEVARLMDGDVKATGLKDLQGQIWEHGFRSGELRAHVYPDVPPALAAWNAAGIDVRIYSSGSIAAQKLFFAHSEAGDLLHHFRGHFDTTTGPKKSAGSYRAIAAAMQLPPAEILFLSDIQAELHAAREAGMGTGLSVRPGNAPESPVMHPTITNFSQIILRPTHNPA